MLLDNANQLPSLILVHTADVKVSYENKKLWKYNWKICGDLKAIAVWLGLQLGYTKFVAFCVRGIVLTYLLYVAESLRS